MISWSSSRLFGWLGWFEFLINLIWHTNQMGKWVDERADRSVWLVGLELDRLTKLEAKNIRDTVVFMINFGWSCDLFQGREEIVLRIDMDNPINCLLEGKKRLLQVIQTIRKSSVNWSGKPINKDQRILQAIDLEDIVLSLIWKQSIRIKKTYKLYRTLENRPWIDLENQSKDQKDFTSHRQWGNCP